MKKYMLAFLLTVPVLLVVWNVVESAGNSKNTYKSTMEENGSGQTDIMQGTDNQAKIAPEEIGDSRTDSISNYDVHKMESAVEMTIEIINAVLLTQNMKNRMNRLLVWTRTLHFIGEIEVGEEKIAEAEFKELSETKTVIPC